MSMIKFEKRGRIALVTLNDPDYKNALSPEMAEEIFDTLMEIEDDEALRCLVMTGEGSGFCSGGKVQKPKKPPTKSSGMSFLRQAVLPVMFAMKNLRVPIITAINGPAVGFGVGFSLMNDIAYAGKSAFFRMAFRDIGIVPDGGATWLLPRLIGPKRTAQLAMLDEKISAEKALSWGMINEVYEDDELLEKTFEAAEKLANGPMAIGLMRQGIWNTWQNSFETQIEFESRLMHKANMSDDYKEGTLAFMERRKPNFTGQ